jgi:hypothetical protein
MRMRPSLVGSVGLVAWLANAAPADAHRLDEYLQATRVSVEADRVVLEIDLTAGTNLATTVFGWMDADGDGRLSSTERMTYAQQVLDSLVVSADGRRLTPALIDSDFPELRDMLDGAGTVRLRAVAKVSVASGRHVLAYLNSHHSESSVYLANALVPNDNRIRIASQRRDPGQHLLTLEYDVAYGGWPPVVLLAGAAAIVGLRAGARHRYVGYPGYLAFRGWRAARRESARISDPSSRA